MLYVWELTEADPDETLAKEETHSDTQVEIETELAYRKTNDGEENKELEQWQEVP